MFSLCVFVCLSVSLFFLSRVLSIIALIHMYSVCLSLSLSLSLTHTHTHTHTFCLDSLAVHVLCLCLYVYLFLHCIGPVLWNNLPEELKTLYSINSFKYHLN